MIVEPLLRNEISIAYARRETDLADLQTPVGASMWATVDEAGDTKIKEQIKAGLFPIRLSPEERTSGRCGSSTSSRRPKSGDGRAAPVQQDCGRQAGSDAPLRRAKCGRGCVRRVRLGRTARERRSNRCAFYDCARSATGSRPMPCSGSAGSRDSRNCRSFVRVAAATLIGALGMGCSDHVPQRTGAMHLVDDPTARTVRLMRRLDGSGRGEFSPCSR